MLTDQLCPTLCDPMDYNPPGSSVYGILQARILEWVAIPFSRGFSRFRDQAWVSCIAVRFFTIWAIREAQPQGAQVQFLVGELRSHRLCVTVKRYIYFFFNEVSGRSGDGIKICGSLHSTISTVPKAKAISMAEILMAHLAIQPHAQQQISVSLPQ